MSRLKKLFEDCVAVLENMVDCEGNKVFKFSNVFNNQVDTELKEKNEGYVFDMPAGFVEISLGEPMTLSRGLTCYPKCKISIHFSNMLLSDGEYMDRNLDIVNIREYVKRAFTGKSFDNCSSLQNIGEELDYDHGNVYKYIIDFVTNFSDVVGSDWENTIVEKIDLDINLNVFKNWESGVQYIANQNVVYFEDKLYLCSIDNSDDIFTPTNWLLIAGWTVKDFSVNDYTYYESGIYRCIIANQDEEFNESNWNLITKG